MSEYIIDAGVGEWDGCITDQTYDSDRKARDDYYGVCVGKITRCKDCEHSHNWEPWVGDKLGHGECYRTKIGEAHHVHWNGFCAWGKPKEEAE